MYDTDAAAAGDESANRWQMGAYGVLYNRAVTRAASLQLHVNIQTPNRPKNLHTLNIRHTTKKKNKNLNIGTYFALSAFLCLTFLNLHY